MENHSLLCDEQLLFRSPPPLTCCHPGHRERTADVAVGSFYYATREERDSAFQLCVHKEVDYVLDSGYFEHLQSSDLLDARLRAARWIIKTHYRLSFSTMVVFDAVNSLDRFISLNRSKKWKYWMVELLSVACLSIAAKSNEVSVPPLLEFQMEDLEYSFQPRAIQRMELVVMKALGWRLRCITAYSYVDLLKWQLDSLHPRSLIVALTARITELLLAALSDPKFSEFRPSAIATAAFRCSLEEILPSQCNTHISDIAHLLPFEYKEREKCNRAMEERVADPLYSLLASGLSCCPSSPDTVMVLESHPVSDYAPLRFSNPKKQKREDRDSGVEYLLTV